MSSSHAERRHELFERSPLGAVPDQGQLRQRPAPFIPQHRHRSRREPPHPSPAIAAPHRRVVAGCDSAAIELRLNAIELRCARAPWKTPSACRGAGTSNSLPGREHHVSAAGKPPHAGPGELLVNVVCDVVTHELPYRTISRFRNSRRDQHAEQRHVAGRGDVHDVGSPHVFRNRRKVVRQVVSTTEILRRKSAPCGGRSAHRAARRHSRRMPPLREAPRDDHQRRLVEQRRYARDLHREPAVRPPATRFVLPAFLERHHAQPHGQVAQQFDAAGESQFDPPSRNRCTSVKKRHEMGHVLRVAGCAASEDARRRRPFRRVCAQRSSISSIGCEKPARRVEPHTRSHRLMPAAVSGASSLRAGRCSASRT